LYLFKLGIAPQIQDLYGKVEFTEEEISAMQQELDKYGIQMPAFSKIGGILANETGLGVARDCRPLQNNGSVNHKTQYGHPGCVTVSWL
ncbi:hypothetical protein BSL78_03819, partial [Apostichopus japonicus]